MQDIEKNQNVIDLTEVLEGYSNKWVILSKDNKKVLKSGDTLDEINKFSDMGIIMLVPDYNYSFTPSLY